MTPNPGFKVTGYLKVEYLADGARVFNCTKHSCRSAGLYRKCAKIGGRRSSLKNLRKKGGNFPAFATSVAGSRAAYASCEYACHSPVGTYRDILPYSVSNFIVACAFVMC